MNTVLRIFRIHLVASVALHAPLHAADADGKLRIVVFGGHPDDAEYRTGGKAVKWARLGHQMKLVPDTNGDLSDRPGTREEVAVRRKAEVAACARKLGVNSQHPVGRGISRSS